MLKVLVELRSEGAVSWNGYISKKKERNETHDDFEKKVWTDRVSWSVNGRPLLARIRFERAVQSAAQYLSLKIPGERNATYTKNFLRGVRCVTDLELPVELEELKGEWLLVPSDGKRGSNKSKVLKQFPFVPEWSGMVQFNILDDKITPEVFVQVLEAAGTYIGIGRYRPEVGGNKGGFSIAGKKNGEKNIVFEKV